MQLDHINTLDQLEAECIEIDKILAITISEQPEEALERGSSLAVYIARTAKMLCDAKYHQDKAKTQAIIDGVNAHLAKQLSATSFNEYVRSCIEKENYIAIWTERLHRTCEKQWEWCRSILSYAKEEMKLR
jgi:hypothetical protein